MDDPNRLFPLTSWLSGSGRGPDEDASDLDDVLSHYLMAQRPFVGGAHLGLIGVVVVLLWGSVPAVVLVGWAAAVGLAGLLCGLLVHRGATRGVVLSNLRAAVLLIGLGWGFGAGLVLPGLPDSEQLFVVVALVGLIAGSAMSLLPDPTSFGLLLASVVLGLTIPVAGVRLADTTVLVMVVAAGAVGLLAPLYLRSHALLRRFLRSDRLADAASRDAVRQRGMLNAILSKAPSAIAIVDRNGCVLGVNTAFEELFECDGREVGGVPLREVVMGEDGRSVDVVMPELGSAMSADELQRCTRQGRTVAVLASSGFVDEDECGVHVVVYEDLSAVAEARAGIERAKEQYRQLVQSAPDVVWRVDAELRWTFVNDAVRSIYQAEPDWLIGKSMFEHIDPERAAIDRTSLDAVLRGSELTDHRTVHIDGTGRRKHLSLSARPVRDAEGRVVGAQGICRDMTAIVEGVAALEQAREDAEHRARARMSFLATVSHEIRTPLNGLLGMTEMLLDSDLDYEQRRSTDLIQSSATSLLCILNDVLDYSKIEAGGLTLEPVAVDLAPLVDSVVRLQAVPAFERRLELAYDIRPEVPKTIIADPGRLRQVLTNLLSNAVKFTSNGEVVMTVSCAKKRAGRARLSFTVRDTGVGIATDRLEAIFQDYVQSDRTTAREYGGTGLGLAIARRLVRMMGGDITVRSDQGEGSTFEFVLSVAYEKRVGRTSTRQRVALVGERALVVGSNGTSRGIIVDQLSRSGVEVQEAGDVPSATELLSAQEVPFDLAIIDAHLSGGLDGFALAQWIQREAPGVQSMMLTAAGQRGDAQRCRDLGITAYLTKPVSRTELLEAVASVVSGRTPDPAAAAGSGLITRYTIAETRQQVRVLYAEDNPVNRTVAESMLAKRGHMVSVVSTGEDAVRAAKRASFDVILMDVNLPGISGTEAARRIREEATRPTGSIVAVTAHVLPEQRAEILAGGFDGYLVKPFRSHELFAVVEGWDITGDDSPFEFDSSIDAHDAPVAWDEMVASMKEAGIVEVVPSLVAIFVKDAPERMHALRAAVAAGAGRRAVVIAHAFKSAAGTIKAKRLAGLLHELEQVTQTGNVADALLLAHRIEDEVDRVHHFLKKTEAVP